MIYAKVISVTKTQSGNPKYRAVFVFTDAQGKKLGAAKTVEANTKADFKAAIRPYVLAQMAADDQQNQIMAIANEALAEVITEETGA